MDRQLSVDGFQHTELSSLFCVNLLESLIVTSLCKTALQWFSRRWGPVKGAVDPIVCGMHQVVAEPMRLLILFDNLRIS